MQRGSESPSIGGSESLFRPTAAAPRVILHSGSFVRIYRTAEFAATPQPCLRRLVLTNSTSLAPPQAAGLVRSVARPLQIANASLVCNLVPSVLPEKVGKKMRLGRVILRAAARDFLAAPRPERPLRAQGRYFPDSFWFRRMYYTHSQADCINFGSAHFRNTRPITILHSML